MTGNIYGNFYGPSFNEIGGKYFLFALGVGSMVGGFESKR